jgi:hypothetical protein
LNLEERATSCEQENADKQMSFAGLAGWDSIGGNGVGI